MNKAVRRRNNLDKKGLVRYPKIDADPTHHSIWVSATINERDALLELFEAWIDEADSINKRKHYGDGGQEGINYLYGQVGKFRTKGKPPGWPQHQGATNQIVRSLR